MLISFLVLNFFPFNDSSHADGIGLRLCESVCVCVSVCVVGVEFAIWRISFLTTLWQGGKSISDISIMPKH